jgi:phage-related protein
LVLLRTVRFYRKVSGECPVEAFLERLPQKTAAKVLAVLKLLEQQPTLSNRFLRKLRGTELFEVRVLASKQAYRFPCFFAGETLVVLTHGFDKKLRKHQKLRYAVQRRIETIS